MLSRRAILCGAPLVLHQEQFRMFANAEAYERFMGRWSRLVAPHLIDFAEIPESAWVLDVGSGTGALTYALAEQKPKAQVLGIDPSKDYVEYAGSRNAHRDRLRFQVGDAQHLKLENASFDAALALLVFNFIPSPRAALLELIRVIKPGGVIGAAVWDYGSGMRMLRLFWDAAVSLNPVAEKLDEKHMPLCREGELATLWKQNGLTQVLEKPIEVTLRFQSFHDFWNPFLLGQGPAGAYVASLSAAQREALRDALRKRLPVAAESTPFTLPARVWAVRGTKPI